MIRLREATAALAFASAASFALAADRAHSLEAGGTVRHYRVHVPANTGGRALPVVVMLHGGGGTGKAAAWETGWNDKADRERFLAVYPDALPPDRKRPSHFSRNPQLWNDGSDRFFPGQVAPDDVAFLDALLDDLAARHAVDARRIYVTGFSNGASMSFLWGARSAKRIAAIAPVAGAAWQEPGPLDRPVPMLYITGDADPLNLIDGGAPRLAGGQSDPVRAKPKPPVRETIARWVRANGCEDSTRRVSEANGVRSEAWGPCREASQVAFVTVAGLGHTWAGGRSLLPESMVGPQTDRLRATDVIWDFFSQHALK